jgi:hypothetical protein
MFRGSPWNMILLNLEIVSKMNVDLKLENNKTFEILNSCLPEILE